jgi:hypothetical protein
MIFRISLPIAQRRANIVKLVSLIHYNGYKFLYIVLTLQGCIWYEPIIMLGLLFPNSFANFVGQMLLFANSQNDMGREQKGHLQVFGNFDLAKIKFYWS